MTRGIITPLDTHQENSMAKLTLRERVELAIQTEKTPGAMARRACAPIQYVIHVLQAYHGYKPQRCSRAS
jgi:hypothetical protein